MIILAYFYKVKVYGVKDYSQNILKNTDNTEYSRCVLNKDTEVVQTIIPEDDSFYKIKIHFDEANKKLLFDDICFLGANIFMTLKDENGNIIEEYGQENIFLDESDDIQFEFPEIKESKNKKFYLSIKCYGPGRIALKLGKNDIKDENTLYTNGTVSDYKICLETCYKEEQNNGYFIVLAIIMTTGVLTLIIVTHREIKLEKSYAIIAIILSFITIIFTNLYDGSDEIGHFGRIYEISEGNVITNIVNDWPNAIVPAKLRKISFGKYSEIIEKINIEENDKKTLVDMECQGVYSPISYIPQIIGIWFARIFISNSFFWPYIVRIVQALSCIILIYYAIKIAPFGKKVIFFLALLPSTIRQTSLISADAILIAGTMLFIAKILQIIYEKKTIDKKDYIILSCLSLIIAISKLVYCPLILLLLLIPLKIKRKDKQILYNIILIIACSLIITFVWNLIGMQVLSIGQGINSEWQIKHYIKRPVELIQKIIYTLYQEGGRFISDLFGGRNLWFGSTIKDSSITQWVLFVTYIILIIKEKNPLDKKEKALIGTILILTYILISVSLLIAYTPVTNGEITGIQGRYFIPLLILIYLIFSKNGDNTNNLDLPAILILAYIAYILNSIFNLM